MEVKSSTSISALDAISEAPETEDVDMMSQVRRHFKEIYFFFGKLKIPRHPESATKFEKNHPCCFDVH